MSVYGSVYGAVYGTVYGGSSAVAVTAPRGALSNFSPIAAMEIFTLHDLVHRLSLRASASASPRMNALFARAIQDAIRGLPGKNNWKYFKRQTRLNTTASEDLTVEYDHTGGTYERMLTATSGSFPDDAQYGCIRRGLATYRILQLINNTTATLEADFSPADDFTDDVQWSRSSYIFPREFSKVHQVHNTTNNIPLACVSTQELMAGSYNGWGLGSATHFSFQNRGGYFGATEFVILPTPLTSETIEVTATVSPLIPKINEISGSGASVVSGSYEVTVPGASFDERCVGCIFRLGLDATPPINLDSANWSFQAFIISVTSSSVLVLSEAAPEDATRGYCISSPIDAEASTMLEYIEDEAYHQYTKNHDHKSFMTARGVAADSLRAAICRDNKISMNGYAMSGGGYLAGGYPIFPDE